MAVAGVFPTVACDSKSSSNSTCRKNNRFGLEDPEPASLALVRKGPSDPVAIPQQRYDRAFHVNIDSSMNAVVLQGADHFQAGAVPHMRQAWIPVPAEVALENAPVLSSIKNGSPGLQLAHPRRGFFGVQFRHAPIVNVLPAAHRI